MICYASVQAGRPRHRLAKLRSMLLIRYLYRVAQRSQCWFDGSGITDFLHYLSGHLCFVIQCTLVVGVASTRLGNRGWLFFSKLRVLQVFRFFGEKYAQCENHTRATFLFPRLFPSVP